MAKQTSIFQFEGRLGEVTGYRDMRGNQIARKIVKASNPQTTLQVAQRTRFLTATGAAAGLKNAIAGLVPAAKSKRLTPRNTLVQLLLNNPDTIKAVTREVTGTDGKTSLVTDAPIDPQFVQLSRGQLELPNVFARHLGNRVEFEVPEQDACDNYIIVFYDRYGNRAHVELREAVHGEPEEFTIDYPSYFVGEKVAVYVYGQAIGDDLSRTLYQSVWNGSSVQAKATRRTIEAGAEYSQTKYLGEFEVTDSPIQP